MTNKMNYINTQIKSINDKGVIEGYASIFDLADHHKDIIRPGAFSDIKHSGIKLLWQHKHDEPIGIIEEIFEDEVGLYIKAKLLLEVQRAREAYALLQSQAINGLSIGFKASQYHDDFAQGVRVIEKIDLWEVSLVTFPANAHATITNVKADNLIDSEELLNVSLERAINILS